jgi:hypothetical protein
MLLGAHDEATCVIPQGSDGFSSLLTQLGTLPDFDDRAVTAAMGSTSDRLCTAPSTMSSSTTPRGNWLSAARANTRATWSVSMIASSTPETDNQLMATSRRM